MWSIIEWPIGTRFEIHLPGGIMTHCIIDTYTPKFVRWHKPEYDGAVKGCRQHRLEDFQREIIEGIVRKVRT